MEPNESQRRLEHQEMRAVRQPTRVDKIRNAVPPAVNVLPPNSLPAWKNHPLDQKFPVVPAPNKEFIIGRNALGEKIFVRSSCKFDTDDPQMLATPTGYTSLHDPHLKTYFMKHPKVFDKLVEHGLVELDGSVNTNMKEFNQYRAYLGRLRNCVVDKDLHYQANLTKAQLDQRRRIYSDDKRAIREQKEESKKRHLEMMKRERERREVAAQLKEFKFQERSKQKEREAAIMAVKREALREKVRARLNKVRRNERKRARRIILEWYCRQLYADMSRKARMEHKKKVKEKDLESFIQAKREFQEKKLQWLKNLEQKREAEKECGIKHRIYVYDQIEGGRMDKMKQKAIEEQVKARREVYLVRKFGMRWLGVVRQQREYAKNYHDSVWRVRQQLVEMVQELKNESGRVNFTSFIKGLISMKPARASMPEMTQETREIMNYILDLLIQSAFATYKKRHRACAKAYEKLQNRRRILGEKDLADKDFEQPDFKKRPKVDMPYERPYFPCKHPCTQIGDKRYEEDPCCEDEKDEEDEDLYDEAEDLADEEILRLFGHGGSGSGEGKGQKEDASEGSSGIAEKLVSQSISNVAGQLAAKPKSTPVSPRSPRKGKGPQKPLAKAGTGKDKTASPRKPASAKGPSRGVRFPEESKTPPTSGRKDGGGQKPGDKGPGRGKGEGEDKLKQSTAVGPSTATPGSTHGSASGSSDSSAIAERVSKAAIERGASSLNRAPDDSDANSSVVAEALVAKSIGSIGALGKPDEDEGDEEEEEPGDEEGEEEEEKEASRRPSQVGKSLPQSRKGSQTEPQRGGDEGMGEDLEKFGGDEEDETGPEEEILRRVSELGKEASSLQQSARGSQPESRKSSRPSIDGESGKKSSKILGPSESKKSGPPSARSSGSRTPGGTRRSSKVLGPSESRGSKSRSPSVTSKGSKPGTPTAQASKSRAGSSTGSSKILGPSDRKGSKSGGPSTPRGSQGMSPRGSKSSKLGGRSSTSISNLMGPRSTRDSKSAVPSSMLNSAAQSSPRLEDGTEDETPQPATLRKSDASRRLSTTSSGSSGRAGDLVSKAISSAVTTICEESCRVEEEEEEDEEPELAEQVSADPKDMSKQSSDHRTAKKPETSRSRVSGASSRSSGNADEVVSKAISSAVDTICEEANEGEEDQEPELTEQVSAVPSTITKHSSEHTTVKKPSASRSRISAASSRSSGTADDVVSKAIDSAITTICEEDECEEEEGEEEEPDVKGVKSGERKSMSKVPSSLGHGPSDKTIKSRRSSGKDIDEEEEEPDVKGVKSGERKSLSKVPSSLERGRSEKTIKSRKSSGKDIDEEGDMREGDEEDDGGYMGEDTADVEDMGVGEEYGEGEDEDEMGVKDGYGEDEEEEGDMRKRDEGDKGGSMKAGDEEEEESGMTDEFEEDEEEERDLRKEGEAGEEEGDLKMGDEEDGEDKDIPKKKKSSKVPISKPSKVSKKPEEAAKSDEIIPKKTESTKEPKTGRSSISDTSKGSSEDAVTLVTSAISSAIKTVACPQDEGEGMGDKLEFVPVESEDEVEAFNVGEEEDGDGPEEEGEAGKSGKSRKPSDTLQRPNTVSDTVSESVAGSDTAITLVASVMGKALKKLCEETGECLEEEGEGYVWEEVEAQEEGDEEPDKGPEEDGMGPGEKKEIPTGSSRKISTIDEGDEEDEETYDDTLESDQRKPGYKGDDEEPPALLERGDPRKADDEGGDTAGEEEEGTLVGSEVPYEGTTMDEDEPYEDTEMGSMEPDEGPGEGGRKPSKGKGLYDEEPDEGSEFYDVESEEDTGRDGMGPDESSAKSSRKPSKGKGLYDEEPDEGPGFYDEESENGTGRDGMGPDEYQTLPDEEFEDVEGDFDEGAEEDDGVIPKSLKPSQREIDSKDDKEPPELSGESDQRKPGDEGMGESSPITAGEESSVLEGKSKDEIPGSKGSSRQDDKKDLRGPPSVRSITSSTGSSEAAIQLVTDSLKKAIGGLVCPDENVPEEFFDTKDEPRKEDDQLSSLVPGSEPAGADQGQGDQASMISGETPSSTHGPVSYLPSVTSSIDAQNLVENAMAKAVAGPVKSLVSITSSMAAQNLVDDALAKAVAVAGPVKSLVSITSSLDAENLVKDAVIKVVSQMECPGGEGVTTAGNLFGRGPSGDPQGAPTGSGDGEDPCLSCETLVDIMAKHVAASVLPPESVNSSYFQDLQEDLQHVYSGPVFPLRTPSDGSAGSGGRRSGDSGRDSSGGGTVAPRPTRVPVQRSTRSTRLPSDMRESVLRTLSTVQLQLDAIRQELKNYGVIPKDGQPPEPGPDPE